MKFTATVIITPQSLVERGRRSDGKLHCAIAATRAATSLPCILFPDRRWQCRASIDEPAKANSNDGMNPYSPSSVSLDSI
jgi:hypothetical protein